MSFFSYTTLKEVQAILTAVNVTTIDWPSNSPKFYKHIHTFLDFYRSWNAHPHPPTTSKTAQNIPWLSVCLSVSLFLCVCQFVCLCSLFRLKSTCLTIYCSWDIVIIITRMKVTKKRDGSLHKKKWLNSYTPSDDECGKTKMKHVIVIEIVTYALKRIKPIWRQYNFFNQVLFFNCFEVYFQLMNGNS